MPFKHHRFCACYFVFRLRQFERARKCFTSTISRQPRTPFVSVEEMPMFPGGKQAMFDFIKNNLVYPTDEKNAGMEGTVYVYFVINKQGKVVNAEVKRGVKGGDGFNKEAIRVVERMPSWSIGKQNGQPANVCFTVPIKFTLN